VEHIDISPFGVKYDREIIIVSLETLKHVTTWNFLPMSCLSQRLIDGGRVLITTSIPERLTSKNMATSLEIDLDIADPS